jgi:hypothetical protein
MSRGVLEDQYGSLTADPLWAAFSGGFLLNEFQWNLRQLYLPDGHERRPSISETWADLNACLLALIPQVDRDHTLRNLTELVVLHLNRFEEVDFKTQAERFVKVHIYLAGFRGHLEEFHPDELDEEERSCDHIPGYSISLPVEIRNTFWETFHGSPRLRDAFDLGRLLDQGIRPSIEDWSVFVQETLESGFHLESKKPCELPSSTP